MNITCKRGPDRSLIPDFRSVARATYITPECEVGDPSSGSDYSIAIIFAHMSLGSNEYVSFHPTFNGLNNTVDWSL